MKQEIIPSTEFPSPRESRSFRIEGLLLPGAVLAAVAASLLSWNLAIILGLLFCGALVCLVATRPLYIFLLWFLPFSIEIGEGTRLVVPTEVLLPPILLVILFRFIIREKIPVPRSRLYLPVALLCLYLLVTLANVRWDLRMVAGKAILRDWLYILGGFFLPLVLIRERIHFRRIYRGALITSFLLALYGLFTQIREGVSLYQHIAYPFFETRSPDIYAHFLAFGITAVLASVFCNHQHRLSLTFLYLPVLGLAVVLSFCRGAWLGIAASAFFYLVVFRRKVPRVFVYTAILAILAVPLAIVVSGLGPLFLERIENFIDPAFSTNLDRIDRWQAAISIWRDYPLLGSGWGTYGDMYFHYIYDLSSYASYYRMGAHNLFLEILSDAGVLGLLLYLAILAVYALEAKRIHAKVKGDPFCLTALMVSVGCIIGYLVHAVVNNLGPSDKMSLSFWFFIAMIPLIERFYEDRDLPRLTTPREPRKQPPPAPPW